MPGALHAAVSTTVVNYTEDLKPDGRPAEVVAATAINNAAMAATDEAKKQMQKVANGREVKMWAVNLVPHLQPGIVTMTCTIFFEVLPVLLGPRAS